jgi:hypothetical protein
MEGGRGGGFLQAQGLRDDALDPDGAISTPDPISPSSDRDGPSSSSILCAGGSIFMRHHDMGVSAFGPRMGLPGVVDPQNGGYAGFCKRVSQNCPSTTLGEYPQK